jgi:23S rRNA pseudouridine2605 synthase
VTQDSNAGERNDPNQAQDTQPSNKAEPQTFTPRPDNKSFGSGGAKGGGDKKFGDKKPFDKKGPKKPILPAERIAKVLARSGLASRREVERLIGLGKIAVNGRILETPAITVTSEDIITVEGKPIRKAEPTRVWRYHKPVGLMTTHQDPQGRPTVFNALPADLPRVISVGRLDMNSEGLLLLTNDGELARALELPATAWERVYRVRALGRTTQGQLDTLKEGVTLEGIQYGPIEARLDKALDKPDGRANLWITVTLSEGKNREVRKVLDSLGLKVNRLIRLAYGPFQLGNLEHGAVEEVGPRVVRELLADKIDPRNLPPETATQTLSGPLPRPREAGRTEDASGRRGGGDRFGEPRADKKSFTPRPDRTERSGTGKSFGSKPYRDTKDGTKERPFGDKPSYGTKPAYGAKSSSSMRQEIAKRDFKPRDFAERPRFDGDGTPRDSKPIDFGAKDYKTGPKRDFKPRSDGPRSEFKPRSDRPDRPQYDNAKPSRSEGYKGKPRPEGDRTDRPQYNKARFDKPRSSEPGSEGYRGGRNTDRPQREGDRPRFDKPQRAPSDSPRPEYKPRKDFGDRPQGERSFKPRSETRSPKTGPSNTGSPNIGTSDMRTKPDYAPSRSANKSSFGKPSLGKPSYAGAKPARSGGKPAFGGANRSAPKGRSKPFKSE